MSRPGPNCCRLDQNFIMCLSLVDNGPRLGKNTVVAHVSIDIFLNTHRPIRFKVQEWNIHSEGVKIRERARERERERDQIKNDLLHI